MTDLALSAAFVLFVFSLPVVFAGGVVLFLYASSALTSPVVSKLTEFQPTGQTADSLAPDSALAVEAQFAAPQG